MSALAELQAVIYAALSGHAPLTAIVGAKIYDTVPNKKSYPFVSFGEFDARRRDSDDVSMSRHAVQINGFSQSKAGSIEAKEIADAIEAALNDLHLTVSAMGADYCLNTMTVERARVFKAPDRKTHQAAVQFNVIIERLAV